MTDYKNLAFTTNTLSVLMTPNHGSSLKHWLWWMSLWLENDLDRCQKKSLYYVVWPNSHASHGHGISYWRSKSLRATFSPWILTYLSVSVVIITVFKLRWKLSLKKRTMFMSLLMFIHASLMTDSEYIPYSLSHTLLLSRYSVAL